MVQLPSGSFAITVELRSTPPFLSSERRPEHKHIIQIVDKNDQKQKFRIIYMLIIYMYYIIIDQKLII